MQAELSLIVLRALNEDVLNEKELMDDARHAELISGLVPLPCHRGPGRPADGPSLMQMICARAMARTAADGDGAQAGASDRSSAPPDGAAVHGHAGAGSATPISGSPALGKRWLTVRASGADGGAIQANAERAALERLSLAALKTLTAYSEWMPLSYGARACV